MKIGDSVKLVDNHKDNRTFVVRRVYGNGKVFLVVEGTRFPFAMGYTKREDELTIVK